VKRVNGLKSSPKKRERDISTALPSGRQASHLLQRMEEEIGRARWAERGLRQKLGQEICRGLRDTDGIGSNEAGASSKRGRRLWSAGRGPPGYGRPNAGTKHLLPHRRSLKKQKVCLPKPRKGSPLRPKGAHLPVQAVLHPFQLPGVTQGALGADPASYNRPLCRKVSETTFRKKGLHAQRHTVSLPIQPKRRGKG